MDKYTVGIFDSGLGGLSAYTVLPSLLPEVNIIYFADTGRNPYGTRKPDRLRVMAGEDLAFLLQFDVSAIIAACGTMSANAPEVLKACRVPVVNVLEPSVRRMAELPGKGPLAVLATDASIRSGAFAAKLKEAVPDRSILPVACQDFVALCEAGITSPEDSRLKESVRRYLAPVKEAGAEGILLGCTHFDMVEQAIRDYLGPDVNILSAAACAAREMAELLRREKADMGKGKSCFYTSGSVTEFEKKASGILAFPVRAEAGSAGEDC